MKDLRLFRDGNRIRGTHLGNPPLLYQDGLIPLRKIPCTVDYLDTHECNDWVVVRQVWPDMVGVQKRTA
jgi:hypothetical protein